MNQFYRMLNDSYNAPDVQEKRPPLPPKPDKERLIVKLKSGISDSEREVVANGLRTYIDNDLTQIISAVDIVNSTDVALQLLTVFFNIGKKEETSFFFSNFL